MSWMDDDYEEYMSPIRRPKKPAAASCKEPPKRSKKDKKAKKAKKATVASEVPAVDTAGIPKPRERKQRVVKPKEKPPVKPITLRGEEARKNDDCLATMASFFHDRDLAAWRGPIYIGIDTGKEGAFGFLYPEKLEITVATDIPTMDVKRPHARKTKKGHDRYKTLYDEALIWEAVKIWLPYRSRIIVAIEETQPRETDGGRTGHAMGYGFGMWPLFLRSHGFAMEMILPAAWKVKMKLAGKDKEWSRLMAQRLWPSASLFRKGDDGRAEALLIAECIRRQREGGQ